MQLESIDLDNAIIKYKSNILTKEKCDKYYSKFLDTFQMFRRSVNYGESRGKLNRATCVFGDENPDFSIPDIWGEETVLNFWTPELLEIKAMVEQLTGFTYNICLCNYYSTKNRTIGWHSDREEFGDTQSIASVSIGSERHFLFRRKGEEYIRKDLVLENGSLLWMGPGTQENYEHCVPPDQNVVGGRFNLTFRKFNKANYEKPYLSTCEKGVN